MLYTTKDIFVMSAAGCAGADPDSLESIMAGSEAGAGGCCITVDLTSDGIAVLCSHSGFHTADGFLDLKEHTYFQLRRVIPKVVTVGQAIELVKCCSGKLAVTLGSAAACAAVRIALSTADMLDNAYIYGGTLVEASRLKNRFPMMHVIGDLQEIPPSPAAIVRAARETRLFGLRAHPRHWTPELIQECRRADLFLVSGETDNLDELERMIGLGINFIETSRPDRAYSFMPARPPVQEDAEEAFRSQESREADVWRR